LDAESFVLLLSDIVVHHFPNGKEVFFDYLQRDCGHTFVVEVVTAMLSVLITSVVQDSGGEKACASEAEAPCSLSVFT
jgi:hypothetical protein